MKWVQRKPKQNITQGDSVLEKISKVRGIKDVNRFLNPTVDELLDPYLLKNIETASNKIITSIKNNDKIVVSYDPDADGITANTIMRKYLSNYTENVDYIYGERNYGHGITEQIKIKGLDEERDKKRLELSKENIKKIKNCDLLILIDSSSNDTETCKNIVKHFGCDIIILDHHEIEKDNPHVLLVNPQQEGDEYPNKQLSGAGVVFKVIQVMEDTLDEVDPFYYMDLVAVGMYSDMMKVDVLENRFMVMYGLRNINNVGLIRILKGGKVSKFDCNAIGFTIAPLLNGVARMDEIKLAIDILMDDDDDVCKKLRLKMKKLNDTRKAKQKEIVEQYAKKVDPNQKALIVLDNNSSKGFNGIVAQQLSERYKRPAIVGRLHMGIASGSFRSFNDFDMKSFLLASGLLVEAMGHPQAGGFEVKEENLQKLIGYIEEELPELEDKEPFVIYDIELETDEINESVGTIESFNLVTGKGFPKIIVRVNGVSVKEQSCIGATQETVKVKTFDDLELIKFRVNESYASELDLFDEIDVVGSLGVNKFFNFQSRTTIITNQVMIEDYRVQ